MRLAPAGVRLAKRLRRGLCVTAAGCAAALALSGCHVPGSSSASGQAPPGSSITVASVPGVDNAPLYIARQNGLFAQAGLTVNIQPYPSVKAVIAALSTGKATVGVGDYTDFFYRQVQDVQAKAPGLTVVADAYDAGPRIMEVLVRPGSGIATPQQLAGKTIGTASLQDVPYPGTGQPYSIETLAAISGLLNNGVQPATVKWQPMPANRLIGALQHGLVDAILVSEPQILQAETQLGATSIFDAASGETVNLPLDGYFARSSYAKAHGAVLRAFRSALVKGQAIAVRAAPVRSVLSHYAGMSRQTASLVTLGVYPTSLSATNLQRVADLMFFNGALSRPLVVSQMIFH